MLRRDTIISNISIDNDSPTSKMFKRQPSSVSFGTQASEFTQPKVVQVNNHFTNFEFRSGQKKLLFKMKITCNWSLPPSTLRITKQAWSESKT